MLGKRKRKLGRRRSKKSARCGTGGEPAILIFDGHGSRWTYSGLMHLIANNVWPFCLAGRWQC